MTNPRIKVIPKRRDQISADGARFSFAEFAGNERKTSGSYYTHDSLVQCLLDSALDPVVEEAIKGKTGAEAERAILALKVCDPAVGSGHFLVGAAHRLARHLARVRALAHGESEPSPLLYQHALRDVIGHCLYGVDASPMAAELCRVSLWLEALEPGKPLSFLDHHIRVGNSLLGSTPALLAKGIPDEAFTPIEGDEKEVCQKFKKVNKAERKITAQTNFNFIAYPWEQLGNLAAGRRGGWSYDSEAAFQWGSFGARNIRAWGTGHDTSYTFRSIRLRPQIGASALVASGSHGNSQSDLGTLNPLFPTGYYFGQGGISLLGPSNLMAIGPRIGLQFTKSLRVVADNNVFWRTSLQDGLYGLGVNLLASGQGNSERYVGSQPSVGVYWKASRHLSVSAAYGHFYVGSFLMKASPQGKDVDYAAVWTTYKF